jgi:anhydro-N-acetylmuramic acid kinase
MNSKEIYNVVGLMSGTSLDGLDVAHCTFKNSDKGWSFKINQATTIKYSKQWTAKLSQAFSMRGQDLIETDVAYGRLLGEAVISFLTQNKLKVDFIASHGHTIFHQPDKGFTYQVGNGNAIHAVTGLPVVYDFRSLDVIRGGEGAPLVPAGDKFLFHEYDVCLNLGGIANLSMDVKKQRLAYDVAFTNMGLNYLMSKVGKAYDRNGEKSSEGEVNKKLYQKINNIYTKLRSTRPSLGREIFEKKIQPLLDDDSASLEDRLRTFTESAAAEIIYAIMEHKKNPNVLCTGGGAFNAFLVSRMLDLLGDDGTLIIPDEEIVKFKEALVFAFLGVLRVRDEANCLQSVTKATQDSSGGVLVGF